MTKKSDDTAGLPFYPDPRRCPFSPAPVDVAAREEPGLKKVRLWNDSAAWLVGRYEDVHAALLDRRLGSDVRIPGYPVNGPGMIQAQGGLFVRMDGPEHTRIRQMLMNELGPGPVSRLKPQLDRIVSEQIDRLLKLSPPVDFNREFSLAIPTSAICIILGIDYDERDVFQHAANTIVSDESTEAQLVEAVAVLHDFMYRIAESRLNQPRRADLVSRLVHDHVAKGNLTLNEVARIGWLLVVAGHETTTHAISLSVLGFLHFPEQREALLAGADTFRAVEEQLRFWTTTQTEPRRVALEDLELGGQQIKKGDGLIMALPAANRDPRHFADTGDPEKLDITREPRRQLAFGTGAHICIGQHLARLEMQAVFDQLFLRIPTLQLAVPIDKIRFHVARHQHGVYELPVTW